MNKRIYFQDKFIEFADAPPQKSKDQQFIIFPGSGNNDPGLKRLLTEFCDTSKKECIYIVNQDFSQMLNLLKEHFYYIEAAGGLIEKKQSWLFIRRHDRWDLPKGKLERAEDSRHAAIRECEEECGISDLHITGELNPTFHVYQYKKGFALKQSFWYYMETGFSGKLKPQLEEHITEVKWLDRSQIEKTALKDTYYTISDVVKEALKII